MQCDNEKFETFVSGRPEVNMGPEEQTTVEVDMTQNNTSDTPNETNITGDVNLQQMMSAVTALIKQNTTMMQMLSNQQTEQSKITNFSVMPDLNQSIGKFSGENGPSEARRWLQQLETSALLHAWPEAFSFETAKSNLTGAAKFWYAGRMHELQNWNDFRTAFRATFLFEHNKTDRYKKMIKRVQNPKGNISTYFHEKVLLCRELELNFQETREQVAIGLWSRELSNYVLARSYYDENDLYQDIIMYERIVNERRDKPCPYRSKGVEERNDPRSVPPSAPSTAVRENKRDNEKCYKCGERGHVSKNCVATDNKCFYCKQSGHKVMDCPEKSKIKCFLCKKTGHVQRNCPIKPEVTQKVITDQTVSQTEKYYKVGIVNGNIKMSALIDTGSAVCTMREDLVENHKFACVNVTQNLYGFGVGNSVVCKRKCIIRLKIDDVEENVEVLIVPKADR
ncbi:Zinc knuckle [Popillia japonica]|uniref:Zinc knuckle n=1 Tax=Popillia japonica TaxID=7064 RepID=A0AAW1K2K5_POPJA